MKRIPSQILPILLVLFCSCAGSRDSWSSRGGQPGGTPHAAKGGGFTICFPSQWYVFDTSPEKVLGLIHDQVEQRIIIKYTDVKEPLPHSRRALPLSMTSADLTAALVEDLRSSTDTKELSVLESGPAVIDGNPGCKVSVRFRNGQLGGIEMMKVFYSTLHDSRLYMLIYDAKVGACYDTYLPDFEATAASFRFGTPKQ